MAASTKTTTLLKGLAVCKLPHRKLANVYSKLLRALARLPETSVYRINTEKLVKERVDIVQKNPDYRAVEEKIGCGQVEELIIQGEQELLLARKMVVWKPWEPLVQAPPENQWTWPPHKGEDTFPECTVQKMFPRGGKMRLEAIVEESKKRVGNLVVLD